MSAAVPAGRRHRGRRRGERPHAPADPTLARVGTVGRFHSRAVFGRRVRVLADHLAGLLPEGARVLDVGCGDGSIARRILDLRPDVDVRGLDVLVRPETHVPVEHFDGVAIPHGAGAFDVVTMVDVLHHTADPTVLLREAARVAGRAVVVKDHLAEGLLARPTLRAMDWVGNAHHGVVLEYNYWTTERWQAAFADAGLRIDTWRTDLGLYPPPASWAFDRRLHVVCRLAPTG
jgi:SAM-dependent methyltransferase